MDRDRIEKILEGEELTDDKRVRLMAFFNAGRKLLREYAQNNSAATLRDLEANDAATERLVEEIERGGDRARVGVYKNKLAACAALQAEGWKVKKTKLYEDAKTGRLRVQADGTVLRSDLDSYVLRAGLEKAAAVGGAMELDQAEKLRLEVRQLEIRNAKLQLELDRDRGLYLLRDDVLREQALKIAALEAILKHWMRTGSADLVYAVGGDGAKAGVLQNLFEARLDEALDEMGRMDEIGVIIEKSGGRIVEKEVKGGERNSHG